MRAAAPWLVGGGLLLAGAAQLLAHAGSLNADGVTYLDMAHRVADGELGDVLIGYWSPLLSILMALPLALVPLAPPDDVALANGVLFLTFVLAAGGYEYLLRNLPRPEGTERDGPFTLVAWALFAWVALGMIRLHYLSPDMLAAALVFWATGAALRAHRAGAASAVTAGVLWGLAGVAKTAMVPLGAFGILAVGIGAGGTRSALRRGGLALAGWLIVAGPYVGGLSVHAGYPTLGSAPRINYHRTVGPLGEPFGEDQGTPEREGSIRVRSVPVEPGITHLYHYDPSRSPVTRVEPGIPALNPAAQIRRLFRSAEAYWYLISPLLAVLVALLLMARPGGRVLGARGLAPLWLPSLAGLGMYALIIVLPRYVAPFIGLLSLSVLAGARPTGAAEPARRPLYLGLAVVLLIFCVTATVYTVSAAGPPDANIARRLLRAGPAPGDRVAVLGSGGVDLAPVLRAARMQVAASVSRPEAVRFLAAGPDEREAAIAAMAAAGAAWAVYTRPSGDPGPDWQAVPGTDLWVRPVAQDAVPPGPAIDPPEPGP